MGTRHLILVFYKGDYHIAQYGQLDGYPSGQGVRIRDFASCGNNLTKLKFAINKGLLYTPTEDQLNAWKVRAFDLEQERYSLALTNSGAVDWEDFRKRPMELVCPSIAAHVSAGILHLVADSLVPVPVVKNLELIADLVYCEWAYVLDLDEHVLEVFSPGTRAVEGTEGSRFDELECVKKSKKAAATMVARFRLDELPNEDDFVRRCNGGRDAPD